MFPVVEKILDSLGIGWPGSPGPDALWVRVRTMREVGRPLSENKPGQGGGDDLLVRFLDCAVLNLGLSALDEAAGEDGLYFHTVRGVFVEGPEAYPGAAIRTKTHVQICVRDHSSILGFFKPVGYNRAEEQAP